MTWTEVSAVTEEYTGAADSLNDYVAVDYVVNDYLRGSVIWSAVDQTSTTWSEAA